jgi:predicted amidohydrolase YtcJ
VIADLIVTGRIASLGGENGLGWVEAIAIADGHVIAAGRSADVEVTAGPATRRLPLEPWDVALPGLTDAHVHLLEAALTTERVDVADARTLEEALALVAAAHRRLDDDAWLEGGGWDPNRWGTWPTATALESAAPGRRIALWAHDHHALLASRRALAEAGIDRSTADPPGGVIRLDDDGVPTGVLHEHASRLVTARVPLPDGDRLDAAIERWAREVIRLGVVALHDLGPLAPDAALGGAFASAGRLDAGGRLPVRVHAGIREESLSEALRRGLRTGETIAADGAGRARVGWWKRFADGSLGSRTAYLREPYEHEAGRDPGDGTDRGLPLVEVEELVRSAGEAATGGIATAVHAIGDAAVDVAIDALRGVAIDAGAVRPRIEHAQLVHDDQLERLAAVGIALSMQPFHVASDAPSIAAAWGERGRRLGYRWRSISDAGVPLAFGTDAPVESVDPWPGLAAAIARSPAVIREAAAAVDPSEALTLDAALRAACVTPALIAGERDRGRLAVGHRADIVVLPLPAGARLNDAAVLATIRPRLVLIDGRVVFEG